MPITKGSFINASVALTGGIGSTVITDISPIVCPVYAPAPSTGHNCVSDCTGVDNGDYQSCIGCHVFVTCTNGRKKDNRPCPANLVWDDNVKRCEWSSDCAIVPSESTCDGGALLNLLIGL
ncbi:hypothetical protein LSAT2_007983 [Lamellibrachia satsuma]|nr:hypothetical protein LSAT2_007983 [Lamellibrachia satsuma]